MMMVYDGDGGGVCSNSQTPVVPYSKLTFLLKLRTGEDFVDIFGARVAGSFFHICGDASI